MTIKHWLMVGGAVACLSPLMSNPIQASPWIEPGAVYERFRLQQAADKGYLDATISTWPMARSNAKNYRPDATEKSALLWNDLAGRTGGHAALKLSGASGPAFFSGFGGSVIDPGEAGLDLDYVGDVFAARLSPSYAVDPTDDQSVRFDGSYLATTYSNWTLGAGYIDRWWGPGWQSSLILSDNARPVPSVWFNRRNTATSQSPWLSWLGPWQFTSFVGQLEEDRFVPSAKLIGMRLSLRPFTGLELGFSRLIQWGGEGQPESASSFWDSLRGKDNFGSNGEQQDPGNQLAGIDVRYGFPIGGETVGLYTQVVGEDEAGYLPSRKVYQFGLDWTTSLFGARQQWYLEAVDTLTEGAFGGERRPNYAYEHFAYRSGMRHLGRNIATSFDADTRAATLGFYHFPSPEQTWFVGVTVAELNRDGEIRFKKGDNEDIDYFVATEAQDVTYLDLQHSRPVFAGEATIQLRVASDEILLADETLDRVSGGLQWTIPF